jgi:thiol-disulfide isomerase/thioredoxin
MTTRTQAARRSSGPNPTVIVGVVVGVLILATIAVVLTAGGGDDEADVATDANGQPISQYGVVTTAGSPLPPAPESGADPAIGMTGPSMLSERAGEQVVIEPDAADEPTMLVFLAHWCPHCQREVPRLVDLQESGALDGIRSVAVLTATAEDRDNFPPSAWLDEEGWTGDRFFDDEESTAAATYGLSSFPMMVFLDADGNVVERLSGEQDPAAIQAAVDAAS